MQSGVFPANNRNMFVRAIVLLSVLFAITAPAAAQGYLLLPEPRPFLSPAPFTQTLSNTTPLVFGMNPNDAAAALQSPLTYVSGRPGNEMFVAQRPLGGWFFGRDGLLYLQFRKGALTGWKGDWERNWMWR